MKQLYILISLTLFFLAGCTEEETRCIHPSRVVIMEEQVGSIARANDEKSEMEEGDKVSFFSQGGIETQNVQLTYQGGYWIANEVLDWNESGEKASASAYYPAFGAEGQVLYDANGQLTDILYANTTTEYGQTVKLCFTHLFAKITFEVEESLNAQIERITFTPSDKLESIESYTGAITLTGTSAPSLSFEKQANGSYSFLVAPAENAHVDILITSAEGEQTLQTSTCSYASGYQYTYQLTSAKEQVGIYTAEDFIAFSHLINGESYEGRSLEEFGTTVDGITTYYLCNDIEFTEEESALVIPIGFKTRNTNLYKDHAFNDCFDGQGHTLYNLKIATPEGTVHRGLFGYIEAKGIVKNLFLENCSPNEVIPTSNYWGGITGINKGCINNCHVKSGTIEVQTVGRAGGLVGINDGIILNCSTSNITFIGHEKSIISGLCPETQKGEKILNSYTTQCDFQGTSSNVGGLCHTIASEANLLNCYTYALHFSNTKYGTIGYTSQKSTIQYCYHEEGTRVIQSGVTTGWLTYTYDSDYFITDTKEYLLDALNRWVDENQANYPDYTLLHWEAGDESTPFIHRQP